MAVLVSGDAAGQTLVFATLWGSTARKKGEGESIPFITKVIRGATLTRGVKGSNLLLVDKSFFGV